jgi:hypothetical protein
MPVQPRGQKRANIMAPARKAVKNLKKKGLSFENFRRFCAKAYTARKRPDPFQQVLRELPYEVCRMPCLIWNVWLIRILATRVCLFISLGGHQRELGLCRAQLSE